MVVKVNFNSKEDEKTFEANLKVVCMNHLMVLSEDLKHMSTRLARLIEQESLISKSRMVVTDPSVTLRNLMKDIRKTTTDYEKLTYLYHFAYRATFNVSVGKPFTRSAYAVQDSIIDTVLQETASLTGLQ